MKTHDNILSVAALALMTLLPFVNGGKLLAQDRRSLTADQIDQLISILPDRALAREIRQRGIDFRMNSEVLAHFREAGAGSETVAVLTELLPTARLAVASSPPNCDVWLNGHSLGTTDAAGKLSISELDAGRFRLEVSKRLYKSHTYEVSLEQNKTSELVVTLEPMVGYLSVSTQPLDTAISVRAASASVEADSLDGCTALSGPTNRWECRPGEYIVRASRDGFNPALQNVRVSDGETQEVILELSPEPRISGPTSGAPKEKVHVGDRPPAGFIERSKGKDAGSLRLLGLMQGAMGGKEKIAAIRDWQRRSQETWEPSGGKTGETTMFSAPSSMREETKGANKTVNYSDGVRGWSWSSTQHDTREVPVPTATGMVFRVLNTLALSEDNPEIKATLLAPGIIMFSDKFRNAVTLTVDLQSSLPRKMSWRNRDGAVLEESYSDWRKVGGVMMWFHMTRARDGVRFLDIRVRDYRVNTGLTNARLSQVP